MRVLCVGAGSMGRRRVRDVRQLAGAEVLLCEANPERCRQVSEAFDVRGVGDLAAALAWQPQVVTVSTPPALHEGPVLQAMERGLHVFSEVPFVLDQQRLRAIASAAATYPGVLGVSHSFRLYPPVRLIRDLIAAGEIGPPLYLEHSLGHHVAAWHPYERYQDFYAGNVGLGGAGTDMIPHEFTAIQWWLGRASSVFARLSKVSTLEVDGPDVHDLLIRFASGAVGFFHNDIIEHGTTGRHTRIVGDRGTIEWQEATGGVRVHRVATKASDLLGFDAAADWDAARAASREVGAILARSAAASGTPPAPVSDAFTYESCYLREMQQFWDAVRGRAPYDGMSLAEELHGVELYHAAFRSSESGREVALP